MTFRLTLDCLASYINDREFFITKSKNNGNNLETKENGDA